MNYWTYHSPLGRIILISDGSQLVAAKFDDQKGAEGIIESGMTECRDAVIDQACRWYDIYFTGRQPDFTPPLAPLTTPFAERVHRAMLSIPHGSTATYADIARRAGNANAVRAAAGSIARNPYIIIVPCHRVIGADGTLHGYAAHHPRKQALLHHEHPTYIPIIKYF